jgi:hypothetical protein
MWEEGWIL